MKHLIPAVHQEPAAQRVLSDLQRRDSGQDAELTNYLRYMEATGHLGSVLPRPGHELAAADRALLRQVAASGTSIARLACPLLRFYEPRCVCRQQSETAVTTALASRPNSQKSGGFGLSAAYPNPAQTTLHLPFVLPAGTQQAEVVAYDLTGRRVATLALSGAAAEAHITVADWASGLYNLALIADGKVLDNQRVSVTHE